MSAVRTIKRVLKAGILLRDLTILPGRGARDVEIRQEELLLGRPLCPDHAAVLREWNGIALDVIRLFGCGDLTGEVGRLADYQVSTDFGVSGAIVVGSDASGFAYVQAADGMVLSFDSLGGGTKALARDMDDFIDRLVFGPDAAAFAGEGWLDELRASGIVS